MPTNVYLIRHCEAQGNLYRRTHGVFNSDITEKGARQLECLSRRMEPVHLDAVYASELSRAYRTAQAIALDRGLTVRVEPGLNERSMGIWEDMSWHEIRKSYPMEFIAWRADFVHYPIPGGESEQGAGERFHCTLLEIAARHLGQTLAIVAHSMVIKMLQSILIDADYDEVGWGDNTSVNLLRIESGEIGFVFTNDNSHLPSELTTFGRERWTEGSASLDRYSLEYVKIGSVFDRQDSPLHRELARAGREGLLYGECFAGLDGVEEAGVLGMHMEGGHMRIHLLYVGPEIRRCGFGSQLLGEAIARLRHRGGGRLVLDGPEGGKAWRAFAHRNSLIKAVGPVGEPVYCLDVTGPLPLVTPLKGTAINAENNN